MPFPAPTFAAPPSNSSLHESSQGLVRDPHCPQNSFPPKEQHPQYRFQASACATHQSTGSAHSPKATPPCCPGPNRTPPASAKAAGKSPAKHPLPLPYPPAPAKPPRTPRTNTGRTKPPSRSHRARALAPQGSSHQPRCRGRSYPESHPAHSAPARSSLSPNSLPARSTLLPMERIAGRPPARYIRSLTDSTSVLTSLGDFRGRVPKSTRHETETIAASLGRNKTPTLGANKLRTCENLPARMDCGNRMPTGY